MWRRGKSWRPLSGQAARKKTVPCLSPTPSPPIRRPCTIKEESRSGRIEIDLSDPLARSAPQGLHLECRHGTCTRARETVGYLWEEVALRAPVQGRVTPTGDHERETCLREMRQSYGPYRADRHASRTR